MKLLGLLDSLDAPVAPNGRDGLEQAPSARQNDEGRGRTSVADAMQNQREERAIQPNLPRVSAEITRLYGASEQQCSVFVIVNNKAEGPAPRTLVELAEIPTSTPLEPATQALDSLLQPL